MYMLWGGGAPFSVRDDGDLNDCVGKRTYLLGANANLDLFVVRIAANSAEPEAYAALGGAELRWNGAEEAGMAVAERRTMRGSTSTTSRKQWIMQQRCCAPAPPTPRSHLTMRSTRSLRRTGR